MEQRKNMTSEHVTEKKSKGRKVSNTDIYEKCRIQIDRMIDGTGFPRLMNIRDGKSNQSGISSTVNQSLSLEDVYSLNVFVMSLIYGKATFKLEYDAKYR